MIEVQAHDPAWAQAYRDEAADLGKRLRSGRKIEHVGSTAVPGLAAKPIIDIMAAAEHPNDVAPELPSLNRRGSAVVDVGMNNRRFLQRPGFDLHSVTLDTWPRRKERLMRDALIADPDLAARYRVLKQHFAARHGDDLAADTRAKTAFVQAIMDQVHDRHGKTSGKIDCPPA